MLNPEKSKSPLINTSWTQEYKTALRSYQSVFQFFGIQSKIDLNFSIFIPLNFAHRIKNSPSNSALRKQFIPQQIEEEDTGLTDPIGDKVHAKSNGIIHRYKNRILFTPTTNCPIICRYCFRKNELSNNDEIFKQSLAKLEDYLLADPNIDEVILTGGDPLMVSDKKIEKILTALLKHKISYVRFHTRTPIIMPSRINDSLIKLIESFCEKIQILFVLHTNHFDEFDPKVEKTLKRISKLPIRKLTQTVLLKDINDSKKELTRLFKKVAEIGFTPYYLHHPDKVKGAMHFFLSLEEGRKIYATLRDELSGWMIPQYVIDHPEGFGKQFAFNPESLEYSGHLYDKDLRLQNY